MTINKMSDGRFKVRVSSRNPKTGKQTDLARIAESLAEAKRIERTMLGSVFQKIAAKVIPSWGAMLDDFFQDSRARGLNEKTVYNIEKCLKAATLNEWSERLVTEITTIEIRDLIYQKLADASASHQKSILKFIRQAFQFAVDRGDLNRNPTPKLAFRVGDKIKKVLTEEQVRVFLNKAKELDWEWYPHCAMAIYTGMRNGELYALTWDKVNLNDRKIFVDCAWNNKDGFKSTKSGHERVVEIAPNLIPIMKMLKISGGESHFVLPRSRDWDMGEQARFLRKFLMGLGLAPVRFHDLRATWATVMLSKGVPPTQVMKMGGWKDMKTMMIYTRMAGIDIKGITDKLDLHNPSHEVAKVLDFNSAAR